MRILYYLFYAVVWTLAWLPLSVLYLLSDFVYFLIYYVVKYRRKVVRENLVSSFPDKSLEEIVKIEKDYYLHLSDTFVETVKLIHISDECMRKHMHFSNPEEMGRHFEAGNSVVALLGHYCNWEWITSIYMNYDTTKFVGGELYRPLKNKYFDNFFLNLRSRFGTVNIPKNDAIRFIVNMKREGKKFGLGFIADQTPSKNNLHYWTTFLNHATPFLNGPERIAKKGDYAVVYFDVQKVKRGYYTCDVITLTDHAKETEDYWITDRYVELFENTIMRNPAYWLWSHRRWKHNREEAPEDAVDRPRLHTKSED